MAGARRRPIRVAGRGRWLCVCATAHRVGTPRRRRPLMSKLRRAATKAGTYLGLALLMIIVAIAAIFIVSLAISLVS